MTDKNKTNYIGGTNHGNYGNHYLREETADPGRQEKFLFLSYHTQEKGRVPLHLRGEIRYPRRESRPPFLPYEYCNQKGRLQYGSGALHERQNRGSPGQLPFVD